MGNVHTQAPEATLNLRNSKGETVLGWVLKWAVQGGTSGSNTGGGTTGGTADSTIDGTVDGPLGEADAVTLLGVLLDAGASPSVPAFVEKVCVCVHD